MSISNCNDVFIVSAARTPIGNFNGTLSKLKASDLGSIVINEVLKRSNVDPKNVSEVIFGQALTAGQGQNPARQAAIKAGIPYEVPAYVINMLCGSGLKSVVLGYQSIKCGDSQISICGGQECMSMVPHVMYMREGIKMGPGTFIDSMVHDGLTDSFDDIHMGVTAENLAIQFEITREAQDKFAERSQQLAEMAQRNNYFQKEIVAVEIVEKKTKLIFDKDEFPKHGTTAESLGKLRPCFLKNGTVTPGNASGINDSAAAILLMSTDEVLKRSVKPMAKIVAWAQNGVDSKIMGIGPVEAINRVLSKSGWTKDEVDLYEINEAFAAQALSVNKCLNINPDKVNISGGAIALGHPIGSSGTRILVTLLYGLERIGGKKGVAALCIGGGMGIAMSIERL